jgi:nickel-dependent lactate racemase
LVDCWLPYGETEVYVSVDMDNLIEILDPRAEREPRQVAEEIGRALEEPSGAPTLNDQVKPNCRVAVAVDGSMTPSLASKAVSSIVKHLVELIVPRDRITIVVGNGERESETTRLIRAIRETDGLSQVKLVNHTRASSHLGDAGKTGGGTTIQVNRSYLDATLKIAVGETRLDSHSGFTGAQNAILPGIASLQTIQEARRHYFKGAVTPGVLELNPVKEETVAAAKLAGVDYALNLAVEPRGEYIGVFAGGLEESWGKAVTQLGGSYEVKAERNSDVTVVSAGGDRFDYSLYKTVWALETAAGVTKKNGTIVLLGECGEGLGAESFTSLARVMDLQEFERRYTYGADGLHLIRKITRNNRVILVSALPQYLVEPLGMEAARTTNEAYQRALSGRRGRGTYVIPHGCTTKKLQ